MTNNTTADTTASGAGEGFEVPVDGRGNTEYLQHVAALLARMGYRVTAGVVQTIAADYDTLRAQLEAAEAELRTAPLRRLQEQTRRAEAAEADAAQMRKALAWYGDSENYYAPRGSGNPVRDDMGNRARRAIAARNKAATP